MNFWNAVVIIVAIVAFANIRIAKLRAEGQRGGDFFGPFKHHNRGAGDLPPGLPSPREEELQREVDELRERVKVLERIATEDRHSRSIAAEIESLRDH